MLGDEGLLDEVEACPAPVSHQIERLRGVLETQWGGDFTLALAELEDLDETERHAVIDAVVAGEESPFVVVNGRVACKGGIDAAAVLAESQRAVRPDRGAVTGS